ncbi:hypothetical protein JHK82_044449 [Glycine max]|uniref:Uncharacterized protein n=1 Tax=Glycine max TaxID=3847 RepID=A0A0R0FN65_SOYBN|nr:hypothetical protein JHK82_044449 [Glycine max]KAH1205443.1 hypothetical protein GmHk_16G046142 [Glycine max]
MLSSTLFFCISNDNSAFVANSSKSNSNHPSMTQHQQGFVTMPSSSSTTARKEIKRICHDALHLMLQQTCH